MIKLIQDTNKILSPIFEDMFGVTPKKFVIVSALVAISFVGLCFTFGVPHGFIIREVLFAINLVTGFYVTKSLILQLIESKRKKLEKQKEEQTQQPSCRLKII